jgi:hypothetical protein
MKLLEAVQLSVTPQPTVVLETASTEHLPDLYVVPTGISSATPHLIFVTLSDRRKLNFLNFQRNDE